MFHGVVEVPHRPRPEDQPSAQEPPVAVPAATPQQAPPPQPPAGTAEPGAPGHAPEPPVSPPGIDMHVDWAGQPYRQPPGAGLRQRRPAAGTAAAATALHGAVDADFFDAGSGAGSEGAAAGLPGSSEDSGMHAEDVLGGQGLQGEGALEAWVDDDADDLMRLLAEGSG